MEKAEINRKKAKLKELKILENDINKEVNKCERKIRKCYFDIALHENKKKKLTKRISHNMMLRNRIISELP